MMRGNRVETDHLGQFGPNLDAVAATCLRMRQRSFNKIPLLILASSVIALGTLAAVFGLGGYRINMTPSAPLGLWQIVPLKRGLRAGDTIFICLPKGPVSDLALARNYLPRGLCPSGAGPLIKTVAAMAGQIIDIQNDHIVIDGERLAASKVFKRDMYGQSLPAYSGGTIPERNLFLHSHFIGSYDSRYFGPVPIDGILGLAKQVFTFSP